MNQVFRSKYFWIFLVVITSLIVLFPNIGNGWVNWDDENYIVNNTMVHGFSMKRLIAIFKTPQVMGNYHPLTLLTYAIEYEFAGDNASVFHTTNIVLHLINVVIVFLLVFKLTGKYQIAFFVSLLFGIHPMHLESVAWISSRKDMLFSLFLLLGFLTYLKYIQRKNIGFYLLTLAMFCLSVLSKGMAIIFPPILVLIDVLYQRKFQKNIILEKIPFFLIAIAFTFIGITAQQSGGAMNELTDVVTLQNIFIGTYGFAIYIIKLFIPFQLSAFHPYPFVDMNEMPFYFYISILIVPVFVYLLIRTYKKQAIIFFGLLFYVISIAPVLQILPFGKALFAERYTYISYIGLLLALVVFIYNGSVSFGKKYPTIKKLLLQGIFFSIIIFAYITYTRSAVWKNSDSLWTDVIDKYPDDYFAYGNRANAEPNSIIAIEDYNKCIELNPAFFEAYNNRGLKFLKLKEYQSAVNDFNAALQINPDYPKSYVNLGLCYTNLNKFDNAFDAFNRAITLDAKSALSYFNRGALYNKTNQMQKAVIDFSNAIKLNSNIHQFYEERGRAYFQLNEYKKALADFNTALLINPDSKTALEQRSLLMLNMKEN